MSDKLKTINDEIFVNTYGTKDVPNAARFGVGAGSLSEIQDAITKRDELSDLQSTTRGPVRRD
jgi:hypothetical protein